MHSADAPVEWLTFPAPDDDGRQFRVNVSFLLSTYRCIFGCGCPSVRPGPPRPDLGCCAHGVEFAGDDDFRHVAAMVGELTPEDTDHLEEIRRRGWFVQKGSRPFRTQILGDACIFANREGGPTAKPGCAFHHLAVRTGRHPADTKPDTCWRVPVNFSDEEPVEPNGRETTIVSAFSGRSWGEIGWWCVEAPEAYTAAAPVYRTFEYELRKEMGDAAYEVLVELLDEIPAPRHRMPAQRLPLLNG